MGINFLAILECSLYIHKSCENIISLNFLNTKVNHRKCKHLFSDCYIKLIYLIPKITKLIEGGIIIDVNLNLDLM